ncbi:ABC transporter ATP-binding protein [Fulvimonas sp. R45]|uniref:ABC transporter ATP-binding protein n=1 Tax=Fulvimonas sp. R45 TaxID=3045937 RepID=UPI00265F35FA|nr:ABC transporter ATP-binding protein [Fulvimonas sp. R45]MDO1529672.1 ABC transporter ATP-binding protein [Fulvimonas sp. R45]
MGDPAGEQAAPAPPPDDVAAGRGTTGLLDELGQLARAVRKLFGAQMHLLAAELGLARSAVSWLLLAGLAATVSGVGLGLTLLGLIGVSLAKWFGSWIWALLALALLQVLFLLGAILLFRRCMHWMSLPATRGEWHAMMREAWRRADREVEAGQAHEGEGEA